MDKVGVSLSKVYDMQEIFIYYDSEKQNKIDYKKFSSELFCLKKKKRHIETQSQAQNAQQHTESRVPSEPIQYQYVFL